MYQNERQQKDFPREAREKNQPPAFYLGKKRCLFYRPQAELFAGIDKKKYQSWEINEQNSGRHGVGRIEESSYPGPRFAQYWVRGKQGGNVANSSQGFYRGVYPYIFR